MKYSNTGLLLSPISGLVLLESAWLLSHGQGGQSQGPVAGSFTLFWLGQDIVTGVGSRAPIRWRSNRDPKEVRVPVKWICGDESPSGGNSQGKGPEEEVCSAWRGSTGKLVPSERVDQEAESRRQGHTSVLDAEFRFCPRIPHALQESPCWFLGGNLPLHCFPCSLPIGSP